MFNNKIDPKKLQDRIAELERELEHKAFQAKLALEEAQQKHQLELAEQTWVFTRDIRDSNAQIDALEKKHALELSLLKDEAQAQYQDNINASRRHILEIESEIAIEKEKVKSVNEKLKVYETAFANMGVDVKDMKGVLDKVVDALVSSNQTTNNTYVNNTKDEQA